MSIERVRNYLQVFGLENRVQEFDVSSATVLLAAEALNCEPAHIAKSMAFQSSDGIGCILIVTAGDGKIDNRKFKDTFGIKAKMLSHEDTAEIVGHAVGGVCPFAVNEGVKIYLDISLKRFECIYPACGSSNSAIGLSCKELEECTDNLGWIDVCKDWQDNKA